MVTLNESLLECSPRSQRVQPFETAERGGLSSRVEERVEVVVAARCPELAKRRHGVREHLVLAQEPTIVSARWPVQELFV